MQLRHFVSGSAVLLFGWLALTYFHQVPTQRYPRLQKPVTTAQNKPPVASETASAGFEEVPGAVVQVSGSR